jgi:Mn-dependent DtxR family transcriptional regulator
VTTNALKYRHTSPTERQLEALSRFAEYADANRVAPGFSDLGRLLGCSKPSAQKLMMRLESHGLLERAPSRYRPYLLSEKGRRLLRGRKVSQ